MARHISKTCAVLAIACLYADRRKERLATCSHMVVEFHIWACFSGLDAQDDSVLILRLKDEDLLEAPDDSAFLQSLRLSCARVNGVYPLLALVEAFFCRR